MRDLALRFTPQAWAKLRYMMLEADTEIGGYGIALDPDDPLLIHDFQLVKQEASPASVDFDDEGLAEYHDRCIELGLKHSQFFRVWIHTHPGESPHPSSTDEDTFKERIGGASWSVMAIWAKESLKWYARLRISMPVPAGLDLLPYSDVLLPVYLDWSPLETDAESWDEQLHALVTKKTWGAYTGSSKGNGNGYALRTETPILPYQSNVDDIVSQRWCKDKDVTGLPWTKWVDWKNHDFDPDYLIDEDWLEVSEEDFKLAEELRAELLRKRGFSGKKSNGTDADGDDWITDVEARSQAMEEFELARSQAYDDGLFDAYDPDDGPDAMDREGVIRLEDLSDIPDLRSTEYAD